METRGELFVRADANFNIGTGHVMRCIALAQAWRDKGGHATFMSCCQSDFLLRFIVDEGFSLIPVEEPHPDPADLNFTVEQLSSMSNEQSANTWLALDGYHFTSGYQKAIREAGHRLLVIDDYNHLSHYHADIVLNQNINAPGLQYTCDPDTVLLLGTKYALLRQEFLDRKDQKREVPEIARKILVTLGGADPDNVTLTVVRALRRIDIDRLEVKVVVGAANPHLSMLEEEIRKGEVATGGSPCKICIVRNANMPEIMAWTDVAVSAGGSTCWELAFMGVPHLVLILAENQQPVAESIEAKGVGTNLGWYNDVSHNEIAQAVAQLLRASRIRAEMSQRGRQLGDGEGVERVIMPLRGEKLRLRQVREDDCRLLWEWANDPEVRAAAFSSVPIPWEVHVQWFARKLHEPTCFLFVAVDEQDAPVGQVRFDVDKEGEAEIDVSMSRSKRRLGCGSLLISRAVEEVFRQTPISTVHAFVKPNNEASMTAFEKAGFRRLGIETIRGNVAVHYVRSRSNEQ